MYENKLENILKKEEYQTITNKENLLFLCFGGSYSYGTNTEGSDIDIRGIYGPNFKDLLLLKDTSDDFYKSDETDTTLYSLKKFFDLALSCNPNIIEMLGCREEDYAYISKAGRILLDNKKLFLSKKAYASFSGYARGQLNRLKNALAKEEMSLCEKQFHVKDSLDNMYDHLENKFSSFKRDMLTYKIVNEKGQKFTKHGTQIYLEDVHVLTELGESFILKNGKREIVDLSKTKLLLDLNMKNVNPLEFKSIYVEISSFINGYEGNVGRRNRKKDDYHLNKHAMHLVRLFLMGIEILRDQSINTYRKDAKMLLDIRDGKYQNEDDSYKKEFFDLIDNLSLELELAYSTSLLPNEPDRDKLNNLLLNITKNLYCK